MSTRFTHDPYSAEVLLKEHVEAPPHPENSRIIQVDTNVLHWLEQASSLHQQPPSRPELCRLLFAGGQRTQTGKPQAFLHLLSVLSGCRIWYTPSPKVMRCGSSIRFFVLSEDFERVTKWSHCIRWIGDNLFYTPTPTETAKARLRDFKCDAPGRGVHPAPIEEAAVQPTLNLPLALPVSRTMKRAPPTPLF